MNIADMANKFEAHVISMMDDTTYDWYMSLTREKRAEMVFNAIQDTAGALK